MKTYTITTDGISNGNVIAQPFTIKVEQMLYTENQFQTALIVSLCTRNGSDCVCANDDIPSQSKFVSGRNMQESIISGLFYPHNIYP